MLSKRITKVLRSSANFGGKLGATPFIWNKTKGGIKVTPTTLFRWRIVASIQFLYTAFSMFRFATTLDQDMAFISRQRTLIMCVVHALICVFHIHYWSSRDDLIGGVNLFIAYSETLKRRYVRDFQPWIKMWKPIARALYLFSYVGKWNSVTFAIYTAITYKDVCHFSSLIPENTPFTEKLIWIFLSATFNFFVLLIGWSSIIYWIQFLIVSMVLIFVLSKETKPLKPSYTNLTKPSFRELHGLIDYQKFIQRYNTIMDQAWCLVLMKLQWATSSMALSGNYTLTCNYKSIGLLEIVMIATLSVLAGGIHTFVLTGITKTYLCTSKVLKSWRFHKLSSPFNAKLLSKVKKYTKPFKMHYGTHYVIMPIRVIMFLHTLIWGTLRVLLTFPCH